MGTGEGAKSWEAGREQKVAQEQRGWGLVSSFFTERGGGQELPAGPLPTRVSTLWVLALHHLGTSSAAAGLQEKVVDSCQKEMSSTGAWGTGLLLLGLPERGRIPRGACIQI